MKSNSFSPTASRALKRRFLRKPQTAKSCAWRAAVSGFSYLRFSSGGTENSLSPPTARCSTNEKKKSTRQPRADLSLTCSSSFSSLLKCNSNEISICVSVSFSCQKRGHFIQDYISVGRHSFVFFCAAKHCWVRKRRKRKVAVNLSFSFRTPSTEKLSGKASSLMTLETIDNY
jgi:hypothetical protein